MNINACVASLAMHNHGLVSRRLLRQAGLSSASIDRWLAGSSSEVVVPGIYRIFRTNDGLQDIAAGVLSLRNGAADLETAAELHGYPLGHHGLPKVVVPHGGTNKSGLALVRQTRDLSDLDTELVRDIRCLTLARTVCELAPVLSIPAAERFITRALSGHRLSESELVACDLAMARRGRPGVQRRRAVLFPLLTGRNIDLTVLERTFLQRYGETNLPPVEPQFAPPWFDGQQGVVDFALPDLRLIVEVDGRSWHTSVDARDNDAKRDRRAVRHGWTVHRFGWDEVVHRWAEIESFLRVVIERSTPPIGA